MTYGTASKIRALYSGRKGIDRRSGADATGQTVAILKAGGLGSALAYTGTPRRFVAIDGLLAMRPNTRAHVYAVIYVDGGDEYNVDYVRVKKGGAELARHISGVQAGELARAYEQAYDGYIRDEQGGRWEA